MPEVKKLYPFEMVPSEEKTPWGTEIYCVADLGFADTAIAQGWLSGNKLGELMETFMERVSGDSAYYFYGRQFPLQVKILKTDAETPVTVCPDDVIASERYDSLGKKKLWYVAKADAGSYLRLGFRKDMDAVTLYNGCIDGSVRDSLWQRPVKQGEYFVIPPGTVHGASAGLEIIEISEASALDFNIFSPYENDLQGITDSLDFIRLEAGVPERTVPQAKEEDGPAELLASEEELSVSRMALSSPLRIEAGESGIFLVYTIVRGEAVLRTDNPAESYPLRKGMSLLVPAEVKTFTLVPVMDGTLLLEASVQRKAED